LNFLFWYSSSFASNPRVRMSRSCSDAPIRRDPAPIVPFPPPAYLAPSAYGLLPVGRDPPVPIGGGAQALLSQANSSTSKNTPLRTENDTTPKVTVSAPTTSTATRGRLGDREATTERTVRFYK
jgi:hypothetical protein